MEHGCGSKRNGIKINLRETNSKHVKWNGSTFSCGLYNAGNKMKHVFMYLE
jgi:hypothetical protein